MRHLSPSLMLATPAFLHSPLFIVHSSRRLTPSLISVQSSSMSVSPTLEQVRRALAAPRIGRPAHERMSPRPRPGDIFPMPAIVDGKQAGVLILLYSHNGELYFFLTRRTESVGTHKGQISLPGGGREGDESLQTTALREAREELDIDPAQVEILGAPLTPLYIPVSEFWVTAFVGYYCCEEPMPNASTAEVFEILPTRLADLLDDAVIDQEQWESAR